MRQYVSRSQFRSALSAHGERTAVSNALSLAENVGGNFKRSNLTRKRTDYILPILATVLSLVAISSLDFSNVPSLLVSVAGIVSGVLFYLNNQLYLKTLNFWIYAQIPAISLSKTQILENGSSVEITQAIFDAGQTLTFDLGFTFGLKNWDLELDANVVPFAFVILLKFLQVGTLIGQTVIVSQFRRTEGQSTVFPFSGKVEKGVAVGDERHWILAALDAPLKLTSGEYNHVLLKAKDGEVYNLKDKAKVSYIRLVDNAENVKASGNTPDDYPFLDWGMVEFEKEKTTANNR